MLNAVIRFALRQRLLVISLAILLIGLGAYESTRMRVDVFPDLNRPRVVLITECEGLAPEEVETLVTFPMESSLNGANGVQAVRSTSSIGLSVIYVEFDWGTDIYTARQIVNERIDMAKEKLPQGMEPQLAPISSLMGQILMVGMWSKSGETTPMEIRTFADWVVRQRLLTIPGVAQVFVMGGDRKQFQVLTDPEDMLRYGITLEEIKQAVGESNLNATGGYLDQQGPQEFLVRALGRVQTVKDLESLVVGKQQERPISLGMVARVIEGAQVKRGTSSAFVRDEEGTFSGGPAVVLTINKQPEADTRIVTDEVRKALTEIERSQEGVGLSITADLQMEPELYTQKTFIDRAVENVVEALRDGGILVIIILVLFLMNFRTTFITLVTIPVTLAVTVLTFKIFGLSINTMTLGGLAVAVGELMDDAIVDVENIFRRLKENKHLAKPLPSLLVVFRASTEIRNSIVFGTMIVIVGYIPLFALTGMEGRLFTPLGVAYIVAILSSLIVSLTLTPVLSSLLLPQATGKSEEKDSAFLRVLKYGAGHLIRFSLAFRWPILVSTAVIVLIAGIFALNLDQDFLPPFDEGVAQLNLQMPAGTSLEQSNAIGKVAEQRLLAIDDVVSVVRRTGRAELDEHAMGVNLSEIIISFDPETERTREEILDEIRAEMAEIPGVVASVEQPLAHLISHMLSGVTAQVSLKLYGDNLETLRREAERIKAAMQTVAGVKDPLVEQQVDIPQIRVTLDREELLLYGLTPEDVNEFIQTAMNGEVVSTVLEGQRQFDLLVRLDEPYREDLEVLKRLPITLPSGGLVPLEAVAEIYESSGPNTINREQVRRRIVISCNVGDRGLVDVVQEIKEKIAPVQANLPEGYFINFEGLYESQQQASQRLLLLFVLMLFGIFLILYSMFRSANFSLQVMMALPMAFIGSVAGLVVTGQTLTIAAMVGFISLGGIASRNGILLLNHYLHLVQHEGESWTKSMLIQAGQERLAPVLMTAMTSGIGLIPLALAAGEPGKEILYPVAIVHIGGLLSCTLLEFLVRPALFWTFGLKAGQKLTEEFGYDVPLEEENVSPVPKTAAPIA